MTNSPWLTEPDRDEFTHAGYDCYIRRNPHGLFLCGYVRLPDGHPWRNAEYPDAAVHGGVTWNGEFSADAPEGWWVGFDCAHLGDLTPGFRLTGGAYRDMAYVRAETESLAEQAAEVGS